MYWRQRHLRLPRHLWISLEIPIRRTKAGMMVSFKCLTVSPTTIFSVFILSHHALKYYDLFQVHHKTLSDRSPSTKPVQKDTAMSILRKVPGTEQKQSDR